MTDTPTSWIAERTPEIVQHLRAAGFSADTAINRQVLNLAEEVGEFVGAYRRWSGQARRSGTAEDMYAELADVVITAYVTAQELGIDLDKVMADKLSVIFSRGWRDQPTARSCVVDRECPADLHHPDCPGLYRTEDEVTSGVVPTWEEVRARRHNHDQLRKAGHGRKDPS